MLRGVYWHECTLGTLVLAERQGSKAEYHRHEGHCEVGHDRVVVSLVTSLCTKTKGRGLLGTEALAARRMRKE